MVLFDVAPRQADRVVDLGVGVTLPRAAELLKACAGEAGARPARPDHVGGQTSLQCQLEPLLWQLRLPSIRHACDAVAALLRSEGSGLPAAAGAVEARLRSTFPPPPLPPHLRRLSSRHPAPPQLPSCTAAPGRQSRTGSMQSAAEHCARPPEAEQEQQLQQVSAETGSLRAGHGAAEAVAGERGMVQLRAGLAVQADCGDEARFIYHEIFVQRCYGRGGGAYRLGAGHVVLDVGANIGLFTLFLLLDEGGEPPPTTPGAREAAARPPWPGGKDSSAPAAAVPAHILAVEPMPPNLRLLRRNVAAHASAGGGARVTVVPAALGASPGTAAFTYYPNCPGNSTVSICR